MRKTVSIYVVLCVAAVCVGAFWIRRQSTPPTDAALVKQFYAHRNDFDELRAMLQEDSNISEVAAYGVGTTNPDEIGPMTPQQAGLSKTRYDEYLATLKDAGAILAVHHPAEYYFLVRRSGFAGGGWGVAVVSRATVPTNQLASVDEYFAAHNFSDGAYRRIEGDWYLWVR